MSSETEEKLVELVIYLRVYLDIPITNVIGHREVNGVTKSCPGMYVGMNILRNKIDDSFEQLIT